MFSLPSLQIGCTMHNAMETLNFKFTTGTVYQTPTRNTTDQQRQTNLSVHYFVNNFIQHVQLSRVFIRGLGGACYGAYDRSLSWCFKS